MKNETGKPQMIYGLHKNLIKSLVYHNRRSWHVLCFDYQTKPILQHQRPLHV